MRILGANDVGMYSPGIAALARAATAFGDVRVQLEELDEGPPRSRLKPSGRTSPEDAQACWHAACDRGEWRA